MLRRLLERVIRVGHLTVRTTGGSVFEVGRRGDRPQPDLRVRLKGALTPLKLALNPDLYLGEAYMDGDLVLEEGSLWDLMDLVGRNLRYRSTLETSSAGCFLRAARHRLARAISPLAARRNAAHHYDLSLALYREFLDRELQYSCAYFADPDASLEAAQTAKVRHIIAKLRLEPAQRVLDIGCGWGGLALAIAATNDVQVTGITLSEEQLKTCRERARRAGLGHRATFELCDYREVAGQFERIVSVGMFEHVGAASHDAFFKAISERLTEDGLALVHSIGQRGPAFGPGNPWIEKYIFPGGYIPAVSEVSAAIERSDLWITDIEILRLHYAETLRHWRARFMERATAIREVYDDRFLRMWEFYLAGCEMAFRHGDLMVLQAQITKRVDTAPLTRDYMVDEERALARTEGPRRRLRASAS